MDINSKSVAYSANTYMSLNRIPKASQVAHWVRTTNPLAGPEYALAVYKQCRLILEGMRKDIIRGML